MFEELLELYKNKAAETERKLREERAMIELITAVNRLTESAGPGRNVELLGRLIDQVDRLSKEVADLKTQLRARHARASKDLEYGEGRAIDKHARALIEIMSERPGDYTTAELVDMLGLNKTTVITVMKRAADLDPRHVKLTHGKRRKLTLTYVPDESLASNTGSDMSDRERMKLELMALT